MIGTHRCQSEQVFRLATAATKSREILFYDCFELMFCVVVFCFVVVVVVLTVHALGAIPPDPVK